MILYDVEKQSLVNTLITLFKYVYNNPPENLRKGLALFNFIDENYGVARDVLYIDKVDCFYNDSEAMNFSMKAIDRIINDIELNFNF